MKAMIRGDMDGIVCAAMLITTGLVDTVEIVKIKDIHDGKVQITDNDIICNLPFHPDAYLWFDHHSSETRRTPPIPLDYRGAFNLAPSTAGVVYQYFVPFHPQLEKFKGNVKALHLKIDKLLTQYEKEKSRPDLEDRFKEINACLMKLGRILMPVLATQAGKYGQDPMGTPFRPIPILRPVEKLNRIDSENEEYKALHTLLVRERNKLSDALNWANRLLNNQLTESYR